MAATGLVVGPLLAACGLLPEKPVVPDPTSTSATTATATPTPLTPEQVFAKLRSGVVRVQSAGCPLFGSGSGFFIGPDLVVTAAHVVDGAYSISIRGDGGNARVTLLGVDWNADIALLKVQKPSTTDQLTGAVFGWASKPAAVSDEISVWGYPKGLQLNRNAGQVNGVEGEIDSEGKHLSGLITYDAATQPGNSGGPLLDAKGDVVGFVDAGWDPAEHINYAVPASKVKPLVEYWQANPSNIVPQECDPQTVGVVTIDSVHPEARALAVALDGYFGHLADNDEYTADQWKTSSAVINEGMDHRYGNIHLEKANGVTVTTDSADVSFKSEPVAEGDPVGCQEHHVEFTLSLDNGFWQLAGERELSAPTRCDTPLGTPTDVAPAPSYTAAPDPVPSGG